MRISKVVLSAVCLTGFCGLGCLWAQNSAVQPATKDGAHHEKATVAENMYVRNTKGEDLGRIEDLAITVRGGKVLYAVLSYGGTLGFGHKHLAVPLSALKREVAKGDSGSGHLVLDIARDELDKMPGFNANDWPTAPDAHFTKGVASADKGIERTHFRRSRYLIGMAARNPQGENLGTIRDLMIDCSQARVIYAVLGHSTGTFSAEKNFAVPWQATDLASLTGRPADECFVIDISKAALDNNAGFSHDNWPSMGDSKMFKSLRTK